MKKFLSYKIASLISIIFLLYFVSCSEKKASKEGSSRSKTETQQKKKKETQRKIEKLYDENVVSELTWYGEQNPESVVELTTRLGKIKIKLYEGTPLHRANFILLTKSGYFNDSHFYRVIPDFVVQGGDSDEMYFKKKKRKIGEYTIPSEINYQKYYHKRGAVAMARNYKDNPEKRSTPYDFYIVVGKKLSLVEVSAAELDNEINIPDNVEKVYEKVGGTPHLDDLHTVFGEVIEGMEIVDKISKLKTDEGNWPMEVVTMQAKVIR